MIRYALMLTALLAGAPFVHAAEDAASASASAPAATTAAPMSEGEIKKVDAAAGKLTIKHGPLVNLGMEPMTMVFRVQDPAMLSKVRPGSKVRFVAEKIDGALTVTALEVE
ncbi:RND transporter [Ralstonia pickettii]|nr:RND transporter [Ralstonia pickettii]